MNATISSDKVLPKTIWIDLDNTPHIPFFIPIIRELENRGIRVVLTARKAYQVCELAEKYGLVFKTIGHHYGKNVVLKVYGWIWRAMQLAPFAIHEKPNLALSHGSRSQVLLSNILRVPTVVIMDYEYSKTPPFCRPKWEIIPEVISSASVPGKNILKYKGIKEDVYVPLFMPDVRIMNELDLSEQDLVVTVRPPATEAHYHNPASEKIFNELIVFILSKPDAKIILLPRNQNQNVFLKQRYRSWLEEGRIIIPRRAVNGLNLLYFSDLVISGGGTMNREAASLGIPVYSIFRGSLGAVDRHLEAEGRLIMISDTHEIRTKIKLYKRKKDGFTQSCDQPALRQIIDHIGFILAQESKILR